MSGNAYTLTKSCAWVVQAVAVEPVGAVLFRARANNFTTTGGRSTVPADTWHAALPRRAGPPLLPGFDDCHSAVATVPPPAGGTLHPTLPGKAPSRRAGTFFGTTGGGRQKRPNTRPETE